MLAVQVSSHSYQGRDNGVWQLFVLIIGLGLLGYGVVSVMIRRNWRSHALLAEGRVVDNVPLMSRLRPMWFPLVEVEANGTTLTVPYSAGASRSGWPLGHQIEVLYNPDSPGRVRLADDKWEIPWSLIVGLLVVGIFTAATV